MSLFNKFSDIDEKYILTDKHVHTSLTDGEGTIAEITRIAESVGLRQIAFTEHIRKESEYFFDYLKEIGEVRKGSSLEILEGIEAKINSFEGELDASDEMLKRAKIRIGSVHRFPIGTELHWPEYFDRGKCQQIELDFSLAAIKRKECNVIGHPGGMSLRAYSEFPVEFFEKIAIACAEQDVAFEINVGYHREVFKDIKTVLEKHNPYVSIGSNIHRLCDIGRSIDIMRREFLDE